MPRKKTATKKEPTKGEKNDRVDAALAEIQKKHGKGTAFRLDKKMKVERCPTIFSGSFGLDIIGRYGGIPRGRITEFSGPEAGGKSTMAFLAAAEAQKKGGIVAWIDAEQALDLGYAKQLGVQIGSDFILSQASCSEEALDISESFIRSGAVDLIVVDSVAALIPKRELEGEMGDSNPGLIPRVITQFLRRNAELIKKTNCALLLINQIRMKIGVTFGNPEDTPGGRALKHYTSLRIDLRRIASIKRELSSGDKVIGSRVRIRCKKTRAGSPFSTAEFDLIFGVGVSREGEVADWAKRYSILTMSGSWYSLDGTRLANGREKLKAKLKSDPQLNSEIETLIHEAVKKEDEMLLEVGQEEDGGEVGDG